MNTRDTPSFLSWTLQSFTFLRWNDRDNLRDPTRPQTITTKIPLSISLLRGQICWGANIGDFTSQLLPDGYQQGNTPAPREVVTVGMNRDIYLRMSYRPFTSHYSLQEGQGCPTFQSSWGCLCPKPQPYPPHVSGAWPGYSHQSRGHRGKDSPKSMPLLFFKNNKHTFTLCTSNSICRYFSRKTKT